MLEKFSLGFNYLRLRLKPRVKLAGFVNVEGNVEIMLHKNATLILGKGVYIRKATVIEVTDNAVMELGDRVFIAHGVTLAARERVEIGADTQIGEYVSIRDHDHDYKNKEGQTLMKKGFVCAPVKIGSNVWIGSKSTIIKGVHIGNNVAIGSNSVVNRDVPANTLVVGAPAKAVTSFRSQANLRAHLNSKDVHE